MTILDYFLSWEKQIPNNAFLRQPKDEGWQNYSWKYCGIKARKLLAALKAQGYKKRDRISILSANCAEWIICDLALMMGGFISVPLYANVNATSMQKILKNSGCKAIITGKLNADDWSRQKEVIEKEIKVISMDGYERKGCVTWSEFCENQTIAVPEKIGNEDILTIIYTSGTTGDPKGVVHTYGSVITAVKVASDEVGLNQKGNKFVSYLPLSHAAERGLIECGGIYCGGTISFIESLESFSKNIQETQPTHFFGVPRIWEKFQSKILEKIPQKRLSILLNIPLLNKFLIKKIKSALGLLNAEIILSGAAPLAPDIIRWFMKLDINIREAYGMSENFNVISMNPAGAIKIGSVGTLFPGQEVIIDKQTKEIKQKCGWLMKGYYKNPKLTKETIVNGYLCTGDMGELSEDGYLKITGRVKDIFKTTKGEYISPALLEIPFLELKIVDQVCIMGTFYPHPFVLVSLSHLADQLSKADIVKSLERVLKQQNEGVMEYQRLKKVIVSKNPWTIENGLLTPTLKLKRSLISEKYEMKLKEIYGKDELVSWEN
ncbi:AMP-binding protein [Lutimonas zeaxanthinifaciens]|uniref:AMP-binding protein n=1 Tax=Lutimonas zeaxanthinifaciens TaxID=3060215 RepID=UPI00265C99F7|nr:AMP-binding protein [Lutimonas sp. YSD2104]WKK65221.1 AMP-binding protein [Lutimonas sp. YSD2104]